MNTISMGRRSFVRTALASASIMAVPAAQSADLSDVERAIAAHKRAWEAFDESCPWADSIDPRYRGPEAEAENERREEAERRALTELCALVPTSLEAVRLRAEYMLHSPARLCSTMADHIELLVQSLAKAGA